MKHDVKEAIKVKDQELFERMMQVCSKTDAFLYSDQVGDDGATYRIFNYRLATYSDWMIDPEITVWMRGSMFRLEDTPKLVCRPFAKFFNEKENLMVMDWDLDVEGSVGTKHDGSLISSYIDATGKLKLKSKGSIRSEQAVAAMALLEAPGFEDLKQRLEIVTRSWRTMDLEYCSPDNRIVLGYSKPDLKPLAIRDNFTGEESWYLCDFKVASVKEFLATVSEMTGIEGFVVTLNDGRRLKQKCQEYLSLHKAKDGISSPKKVAEVILNEALDDLKSMFSSDVELMKLLTRIEEVVSKRYNSLVKTCEEFYEKHNTLDRKFYAIEATKTPYLGLLMNLYLKKDVAYKDYFMKNFDEMLPDVSWYTPHGVSM